MRLGGESASILMDTNLTSLAWGNRIIERKVFIPYTLSTCFIHKSNEEEISSLVTSCIILPFFTALFNQLFNINFCTPYLPSKWGFWIIQLIRYSVGHREYSKRHYSLSKKYFIEIRRERIRRYARYCEKIHDQIHINWCVVVHVYI